MSSLLPSNATDFEKALETVMKSDMSSDIRYLWNPWKCPVDLLWVLAIVVQLDEWDENWPEESKRTSIAEAFSVHALKGTPGSIRRVLSNAGYGNITFSQGVVEGAWYMYRIYLDKAITNAQAIQVKKIINATAPEHCELAGLDFTEALFLHNGEIYRNGTYNRGTA